VNFDIEKVYGLLPSYTRTRDAEQGEPLKALLSVIAEQIAVLEDDLEQLYDDQFIETCQEWVVPYIGDLVGARGLFVFKNAKFSQRALVADTVAERRRKGTSASLDRLARDVTQWDANVVEYFLLLATTQYMKHIRPGNLIMPNLRRSGDLERIGTPFDTTARTFEARRIESNGGKYNIPNIGIFLWRILAYRLVDVPPFAVGIRRFQFDPLGKEMPLYSRREDHPNNVPEPITRRVLSDDLARYYGDGKSIAIRVNGTVIAAAEVRCCNLEDADAGKWAQEPGDKYVIDPVLGRFLVPNTVAADAKIRVLWHYGFSADIGGGMYPRETTFSADLKPITLVKAPAKIQDALDGLVSGGAVEVQDSEIYLETISIHAPASTQIELRAKDSRPVVQLAGDARITGDAESSVTLNGLVITGGALRVPAVGNNLGTLRLRHCTILPGSEAALIVELPGVAVKIDSCIIGGIEAVDGADVTITNSIVDAGGDQQVAFAGLLAGDAGATLQIENTTVIGKVHTLMMKMASNSIFLSRPEEFDFSKTPVEAERLQEGCVRFCYVPPGSRVPRRYHCQPDTENDDRHVRPVLTSQRYGDAGYCQLSDICAAVIREGADDRSEIGAFHDLFQPQRAANLRARLDEYLRFGLEAGIFFAS
jgi:hypothetical protein